MNAERLLDVYEQISEAPDAIGRLRRFVLDLAVRGKLVGQDAGDEPAQALVGKIEAERKRQVKDGEIRKRDAKAVVMLPPPYELPDSWTWIAVGNCFVYDAGAKTDPKNLVENRWLLELEDVEKDTGRLLQKLLVSDRDSKSTKSGFDAGNVLYGKLRPYLNKVIVADDIGYSTTEIVAIRPYRPLCSAYVALAFRRPDFVEYVERKGQGTKMPRLRTEDAVVAPFPLPPLAEQHRIVAKVDELMALCDRLEAARKTREEVRDKLTAASLARLTAPDTTPEDFPAHARFALEALPSLTTRPDQIKTLRQTILNLAVRGKLVEQDAGDEPASILMKAAKALQADEGIKLKADPLQPGETPFPAPLGWLWTRVGLIALQTGSGSTPRGGKSAYADEGTPFLRSQNIYDDGLRLDDVVFINDETNQKMKRTQVKAKDLLLNITGGSIGRCTRVPDEFVGANVSQHVAIIRTAVPGTEDYLHLLIKSPFFQDYVVGEQTGAGRGGLPKNRMDRIPVPLPPLAEQHRIVAKVDALMALCDRLEAALTTTDTTRTRLLEALLHEALEPASSDTEAAA